MAMKIKEKTVIALLFKIIPNKHTQKQTFNIIGYI